MTSRKFKHIRQSIGLSQSDLGQILGRSVRMIKYYESRGRVPFLVADKMMQLKTDLYDQKPH